MRKQFLIIFILIFIVASMGSCVTLSEGQRKEYGILESAVTFASDKVIGEYGDVIPNDFTGDKFMKFVENKIPEEYYKALRKYHIDVKPKGSYYQLSVIRPKSEAIILFDFSCTPEADGPVLLDLGKYDVNNLDLYDTCKSP